MWRDWLAYHWDRVKEIHYNMRTRMQARMRRMRNKETGKKEDSSKSGLE